MTKQDILEYFKDINHAYNDCTRYDTLKHMLDELQEPSISDDGTLTVNVEDGSKVSRVLVCGDNHFGGLYYPE